MTQKLNVCINIPTTLFLEVLINNEIMKENRYSMSLYGGMSRDRGILGFHIFPGCNNKSSFAVVSLDPLE